MKRNSGSALVSALVFLLTACASSAVDMSEPRRIVGTENFVRVDAQVTGEEARPGQQIPITWEITNQRSTPIAVADLIPQTSYDAETHTFTVTIGSEVPGNVTLPRLIAIEPGQKRSFSALARLVFITPGGPDNPMRRPAPAEFRLRVNFLGDTGPFADLVGLKENAVADPKRADELFAVWLEKNEVVYTNSIPMRWVPRSKQTDPIEARAPGRRRGGI